MSTKDSGRSWIVLAVVTFTMFLEIGTIKAFSVLLPELKEQLNTQTWIVGSSVAIVTGFGYITGLISGTAVDNFGARACVMTAGLISCCGFIVCAFATSPYILLLGLLLSGLLLLQETILQGTIPEYFDKYYELAVGVYSSGTALGILILPQITQVFLSTYGWRGTLVLLAGLFLNSIPFSGLIKFKKKSTQKTRNVFNLTDMSYGTINDDEDGRDGRDGHQNKSQLNLGVSLIVRPAFISRVIIPSLVVGYTLTGWMIYMVSFADSRGATLQQATNAVSIAGVSMLITRLFGLHLLHKILTYKHLLHISSILVAISLSLMTVFDSILAMNILSVIFGIGHGIMGSDIYIAATSNAKDCEHYHAIAWSNLCDGAASILSGFVTGYFFDKRGDFTVSFNILAVVSVLTVLSLGIGDIFIKEQK